MTTHTIRELITSPSYNDLRYGDYRTASNYKERQGSGNQAYRYARKLIARGLLKPFGVFDTKTDALLNIDGKLYALPLALVQKLNESTIKVDKRAQFLEARSKQALYEAKNFFCMRYVKSIQMDNTRHPSIYSEDPIYGPLRKYNKLTLLSVHTCFAKFATFSTSDFLVHNFLGDIEYIDDIAVVEVRGWWKSDIKGTATHYPKTAWLAYDANNKEHRTITNSRATAIRGLNVRLTNKVTKLLVA